MFLRHHFPCSLFPTPTLVFPSISSMAKNGLTMALFSNNVRRSKHETSRYRRYESSTTKQNGEPNIHVTEAGNSSTHWLNLARSFFSSAHKVDFNYVLIFLWLVGHYKDFLFFSIRASNSHVVSRYRKR